MIPMSVDRYYQRYSWVHDMLNTWIRASMGLPFSMTHVAFIQPCFINSHDSFTLLELLYEDLGVHLPLNYVNGLITSKRDLFNLLESHIEMVAND